MTDPLTVDDILRDPASALQLPDGAIPVHAVVLVEYVNPGSSNCPGITRLGMTVDSDAAGHTVLGMLAWAEQLERNAVADAEPDDD